MNRIIALLMLTALFCSCKKKESMTFAVSGTIANAAGSKLFLIDPYSGYQQFILDTTKIKDDGSFSLKGNGSEEGIYRLLINHGPEFYFINDNDNIRLHLDASNRYNYKVEGSPATQSMYKLMAEYGKRDSIISAANVELLKQRGEGNDSLLQGLRQRNKQLISEQNELLKNFIENAESPAAAFYALGQLDYTLGMEGQIMTRADVKKLIDEAADKFPKHRGLARVKQVYSVTSSPQAEQAEQGYPLLNKQAPELTMADVNGKPVSISSFKGKYVLVDFWASWCGPCRQENPNVVAAYNAFKDKNFTVLGVSLDENKAAWQKAIASDNLTWTHMSDLKGWHSAAVEAYGFDGIPFNVLLDPTGKIIASSLRGEELAAKLKEVLK